MAQQDGHRKREHSRNPDEIHPVVEACAFGPYLELFARSTRENWAVRGNAAGIIYKPKWPTYAYNEVARLCL